MSTVKQIEYKRKKMDWPRFKRELPLHLMLIPGIIITLIYSYLPMYGIIMAFQDFNVVLSFWRSPFVGLDNFRYILGMPQFARVFRNTFLIATGKTILRQLVPLIIALLINEVSNFKFKKLVQTSMFLPFFLSWTVLAGVLKEMFSLNGVINYLLTPIVPEGIFFMNSNFWFPIILIVTDVWKGMGYNIIIYLAAITGIDPNLYEAAAIDGCGRWRQTIHITLPGMRPIIILLATLSIGSLLDAGFDQILLMYNPAVHKSSDVISTFVYRIGLINGQLEPAAAVGLFTSVIGLVLVGTAYYCAYRFSDYRIF